MIAIASNQFTQIVNDILFRWNSWCGWGSRHFEPPLYHSSVPSWKTKCITFNTIRDQAQRLNLIRKTIPEETVSEDINWDGFSLEQCIQLSREKQHNVFINQMEQCSTHLSARTNMMFLSTNQKTFVKPVLGEVTSMCGFHPCEFIFTHRALGMLILFMHLVDGNC